MQNVDMCSQGTGCCIEDRCFVPDRRHSICRGAGEGFCYAKNPPFQLSVNFGSKSSVVDLGDYISSVYKYAVGIGGLLAAVMLMIGGFLYLTAADSERISRGKQFIVDALTGLVVILGAYLLLNTINPDTVSLSLPKIPVIKKETFVGCTASELCRPCGEKYGLTERFMQMVKDGRTPQGATLNGVACSPELITTASAPGVTATCFGKSCSCATGGACSDLAYRCRKPQSANETSNCTTPLTGTDGQPINPPPAASGEGTTPAADPAPAGSTYMCMSCKPERSTCSKNGPNDECCTGFCAGGKCTAGQVGDPCGVGVIEGFVGSYNDQCVTKICQTNWGNFCSAGSAGTPCGADDKECKPGYKCSTNGNNECTPGTWGSWCDDDSECQSGFRCDTEGFNICMPSGVRKIFSCSETISVRGQMWADGCNAEMPHCVNLSRFRSNFCTPGNIGNPCSSWEHCQSHYCVTLPGRSYGTCTDGLEGSPCQDGRSCKSGFCYKNGAFQGCVTGGPGSRCNGPSGCLPNNTCENQRCIPQGNTCGR